MPRMLTLKYIEGKKGEVYYPIQIKRVPKPVPQDNQVLVRITAAALNHRDVFMRQRLYPAINFDTPMLGDGAGTVIALGPSVKNMELLGKSVALSPVRGWDSDPISPEDPFKFVVIGSAPLYDDGAAQDYIAVSEDDVVPAPAHLSDIETAAIPVAGLTAWRALVIKAGITGPGKNVLVTGVGGGVALFVLQFAVAFGSNVYVTSGKQWKIDKAIQMGAKGGVSYKEEDWGNQIWHMLPEDRPFLDAVIDGAGSDVVAQTVKVLRRGGIISQYGMTVSPKMQWSMPAVINNIELKGSTMGSRKEFREMIDFIGQKKIKPVVSRTAYGLDNMKEVESLFTEMHVGEQFGKLVIEIGDESASKI